MISRMFDHEIVSNATRDTSSRPEKFSSLALKFREYLDRYSAKEQISGFRGCARSVPAAIQAEETTALYFPGLTESVL